MRSKVVALVGMPGAGKTEVGKFFVAKGYQYLRFGQIVLDEAIRLGSVNEKTEREIRNGLRKKFGMGAMAKLNLPKIRSFLRSGNVLVEDLYSWDEYKILKKKFGKLFTTVAVVASPKIRYRRLARRHYDPAKDKKAIYRSYSPKIAASRDFDQIENAAQGGPIAMADFYIVNEGTKANLNQQLTKLVY